MVQAGTVRSVVGKRRRDETVLSLDDINPSKTLSGAGSQTSQKPVKRLRRSSRFSVASFDALLAVENKKPISERAKRAQLRASRDVSCCPLCKYLEVTKACIDYTAYTDLRIQCPIFNAA
jgi:hypothetical protein